MAEENSKPSFSVPRPHPASGNHSPGGVVSIVGDTQMPREFITTAYELDVAAVMAFITDENTVNNIVRLYNWATRHHCIQALNDLRMKLNLLRSINGRSSKYALMGHTGIISPDALDIKPSKRNQDDMNRVNELRNRKIRDDDQHAG